MRLGTIMLLVLAAACATSPDYDEATAGLEGSAWTSAVRDAREKSTLVTVTLSNVGDELMTIDAISLNPPLRPVVTPVRKQLEPGGIETVTIFATDSSGKYALLDITEVTVSFTVNGKRLMKRVRVEIPD